MLNRYLGNSPGRQSKSSCRWLRNTEGRSTWLPKSVR
jgi:hypothetical protein